MTAHLMPTGTASIELDPVGHLDRLIAGWLLGYRSELSRSAELRDVRAFRSWCAAHDADMLTVRRAHLDAYARHLEAIGRRPTTVARALASLSSLYRYLVAEDHLAASPAADVRRPATGEHHVALTPAIERSEVARLLEAADTPRDRALVLLLVVLGLRVSEAVAIDLDAVQMVRGHHTVLVIGKGGRVDRMPLPPVLVDAFDAITTAEARTTGPVLIDTTGERMSRHSATRVLARLARRAGLAQVRPHTLRATAITGALDAGATLRDVQDMARHADPRTTRRYDRARSNLDRHASYTVAGWLGGVA